MIVTSASKKYSVLWNDEPLTSDCIPGNESIMSINEKMGFRRKLVHVEKEFILEKLFLHENQKCI